MAPSDSAKADGSAVSANTGAGPPSRSARYPCGLENAQAALEPSSSTPDAHGRPLILLATHLLLMEIEVNTMMLRGKELSW